MLLPVCRAVRNLLEVLYNNFERRKGKFYIDFGYTPGGSNYSEGVCKLDNEQESLDPKMVFNIYAQGPLELLVMKFGNSIHEGVHCSSDGIYFLINEIKMKILIKLFLDLMFSDVPYPFGWSFKMKMTQFSSEKGIRLHKVFDLVIFSFKELHYEVPERNDARKIPVEAEIDDNCGLAVCLHQYLVASDFCKMLANFKCTLDTI